jgi:hypothetical protein
MQLHEDCCLPRNAENPTKENMDGRKANALIRRYGLAYFNAGAPFGKTALRAQSGLKNSIGVKIIAIKKPTNKA